MLQHPRGGQTIKLTFKIILICLPASAFVQRNESAAAFLARDVDILWVSLSAALVFFMQAGFLMLEAGLVRARNTINVAIKNIVDFITGTIGFYIIGFGLIFGASVSGFTGSTHFMLSGITSGNEYAFFLFQVAFMGTATTIISGAVAERIKFSGYVISSLVISIVIYPVFRHWVWGGGWLAEMGFIDFAGSTVVHSVGGWVGLAGIMVLGPRLGKFDEHGKPREMYGHNLTLSVLGALILWFGWFGFNGGSTLAVTDKIPLILVNTTLSASAGGLTANKTKKMADDAENIFSFSSEILEGVKNIGGEPEKTGKSASATHSMALKGEEEMAHTVKGMEMISRNSIKVKEILSFLSEISDQLNMLSLNASIEAARSGVHGMGFSIVAGEMNKLADLTRIKTKEADTYISQMAGSVTEGKSMLAGSARTFAGIKMQIGETNQRHKILLDKSSGYLEKINSINALLEDLSQNASDIFEDIESRSLELGETYNAVNEINEGIGALQMESEKLSSTSLVMNSQSEKMKEAVMDFNPEPEETEKGLLN
jgi:uncharacterized protein YoxC